VYYECILASLENKHPHTSSAFGFTVLNGSLRSRLSWDCHGVEDLEDKSQIKQEMRS
jgi:hypothetical protein